MKRRISLLLIVVLLFSILPVNAFAIPEEQEIVIETVAYDIETKLITITGTAQCEQVIVQIWTTTEPQKMIAFDYRSTSTGTFNILIRDIDLDYGTYNIKMANFYGGRYASKSLKVRDPDDSYVPPVNPTPAPSPVPSPTPKIETNDKGESIIIAAPEFNSGTGEQKSAINKEAYNEAVQSAKENDEGIKSIVLQVPENKDAKTYKQELPSSALSGESDKEQIRIETGLGSITVPSDMLNNVPDLDEEENVAIVLGKADTSELDEDTRELIGDKPVIKLSLQIGDKTASWNNPDAPVTVSIPYTPTPEELEDPEHIVVWYIDGEGNVISIPNGRYDPETGTVVFETTHFSMYTVAYVHKTYDDIANSYAKKQIEVLASKGFYSWIEGDTFDPVRDITRAEFIYLMMTALNINTSFKENFNDVKPEDYYYQAIGAAKKLGITVGVGNNNFGVNQSITRQDMSTILFNALKVKNSDYAEGSQEALEIFKDKDKITSYAKKGLAALVRDGILVGYNNILDPDGKFNMQQAAVVVYKIYNNTLQ